MVLYGFASASDRSLFLDLLKVDGIGPKGALKIMLVSAFAGREHILNAYKIAVEQKYRFFSYGDAMFIK